MELQVDYDKLQQYATQTRRDILRMTNGAKSGHPGGALGCTEFFIALYYVILEHNPRFDMDGIGEDFFILSNGHVCPGWYSVMARWGYFPVEELSTFRKRDSRLQGHPATAEGLEGVRIATGSLGQGLSASIGAALAKKQNNDDKLIFSLHGDGELEEGQNWEAMMFANHHKVDNIIATIDYNNAQIDGPMEEVMSLGDLKWKLEAFGWKVLEMDGNDMKDVIETLQAARLLTGKGQPISIIMKTVMGKGVDYMENDYRWHGKPPNDEQLQAGLEQLEETIGDY